ncbi:MAG TPA: ABC transporter ATP-binding protein [Candidatus Methylomirabilis sp.]|nr:ABC transporter ATP-binding protein [Candidatus Methylomirabilis sp.]
MLKVEALSFSYGKVPILHDLRFTVPGGEITSIIGSNGAGKSTTLLTISGYNRAKSGTVEFCGERIEHLAPHEIASRGLVHVPEGRELFPSLTVAENLEMGSAISAKTREKKRESLHYVFSLFPILERRKGQRAGSLSGGEQQMLAVGRGLMSCPKLLLLDEPSLGLGPLVARDVFRMVKEINVQGVTILLVEQNALRALAISQRGYVLENGHVTFEGAGKDLLSDERVRKAYLGV